jgi:hypothetical protein
MATMKKYRLGKDAQLSIDGVVIQSIIDDMVRVRTEEMSVASGVDIADSTLVYRRTLEIQAIVTDPAETAYLLGKAEPLANGRPQLVVLKLDKGHIEREFYATVHDIDEDRPLVDTSKMRWLFKQWGKLPMISQGRGGYG